MSSTTETGGSGTGARLSARLVALNGVAPDPVHYVLFRSTRRIDGTQVEGYSVADEVARMDATGLDAWLARQPTSVDRLAVAVLVIREIHDTHGLILQCAIERRRGLAEGPFCGDPARVEFTGAASAVRLYSAGPDGRLVEITPHAETAPPDLRPPEHFAGEQKALQTRFGDGVRILDAREPTLFEDMAGLSSIVHVRTADGREVGCGVGWHGDMAFVLEAEFPRLATSLELLKEDAAAVDAAVRADSLVRGELRLDGDGIAVHARRRGAEDLFLLRPASGQARTEPHAPSRNAAVPDQQKWLHFAETYEALTVLDVWRDGSGDGVIVLTGDASGQLWRHHIDVDGVEAWRRADNDAAFGALHREHLCPGALAVEDAEPARGDTDASGAAAAVARRLPDVSLLTHGEAYVRAMTALRDARDAVGDEAGDTAAHVAALRQALDAVEAHVAAEAAQDLLRHFDTATLTRLEALMRAELALIQCVAVAPPNARALHDGDVLGADVTAGLPAAAYDIGEAAICLALRRPTASVFHCMKVVECGIGELARRVGVADPVGSGERDWQAIMRLLHRAADVGFGTAAEALDEVRRRWCGGSLVPAEKYTEAEAERIFQAIGGFMRALFPRV
jgi:hypothetical protein